MSEEKKSLPDLSEIIGAISGNPKALAMLSSLLGGIETEKSTVEEKDTERKANNESPTPRLPAPIKGTPRGKNEDRRRLLMALKPFLSHERCQAVDTLLLVLEGLSLLSMGKEPPCT